MREEGLAPARPVPARGASRTSVKTAAAARAHARAVVEARWNDAGRPAREEDVIDLLLVVSELVTNALRHGGGLAGFEMTPLRDGIRIAVRDHSDTVPAVKGGPGSGPAGHRVGGYGWPLVVRLARDIGVEKRAGGGKTITMFVPIRTVGRPD
ncbi:ATP-binding protein [Streptomyces rishiriensis]|uniref:Anti-sigma regulatory factor (Ser/Thr protein kinase) n=1 Tax=Streptomyces rishiriensis TaxID=68264 RepID=A0ABU0NIS0_STRRH|nr:ATP-binding protein [Streptomyces rishiriensis]MDQ0579014.1 anti-sigma regulatory factor (Ser/Thr protein kinase) [Streptomyces rishiriensis]